MTKLLAHGKVSTAIAPAFRRCGDTGLLLEFDTNESVHRWATSIRANAPRGVINIIPAMTTILVVVDPQVLPLCELESLLGTAETAAPANAPAGEVEIGVRYDGDDLGHVSELTGLTPEEVVSAHTSSSWRVAFCGFSPGFAYLVGGDPRLSVPRRGESRLTVPAGAVAIAGQFSAIYPRPSPGGWQLLGSTDVCLWDLVRDPPTPLVPGVRVRFRDLDR